LNQALRGDEWMSDNKMTIFKHLEDLRRVLVVSAVAIAVASSVAFYYRDWLMKFITSPVNEFHIKLVYTGMTEGVFTYITLALIAGLIAALPIILWQIWGFIVPALYPNERRWVYILVPTSLLLFAGGLLFAYYSVFRVAVKFFVMISGDLQPMITIAKYLSFTIWFLLPFGLVFELPLVVMFLTRIGMVTPEFLVKKRKYALLIIFIVAAVLTPTPDPLTQTLMGGPMYLLYEISILVSKMVRKKKAIDVIEDSSEDAGA